MKALIRFVFKISADDWAIALYLVLVLLLRADRIIKKIFGSWIC